MRSSVPIFDPDVVYKRIAEFYPNTVTSTATSSVLTNGRPRIKKVIFHDPATIVYWKDGTKTVVKCKEDEEFDKWTGLAMAHMKKIYKDDFHSIFKEYCKD